MRKRTYTQLSESERQAIALGREQKLSLSAIARALGRHKSTISRECRGQVISDKKIGFVVME